MQKITNLLCEILEYRLGGPVPENKYGKVQNPSYSRACGRTENNGGQYGWRTSAYAMRAQLEMF